MRVPFPQSQQFAWKFYVLVKVCLPLSSFLHIPHSHRPASFDASAPADAAAQDEGSVDVGAKKGQEKYKYETQEDGKLGSQY